MKKISHLKLDSLHLFVIMGLISQSVDEDSNSAEKARERDAKAGSALSDPE